jgi:nitroreductase
MLKKILLKILPKTFNVLKQYGNLKRLKREYYYDINRFFKFSDYFFNNSEKRCVMRIIHRYHPIEKGLTMPEMRLGFGYDNIIMLIDDCNEYKKNYIKEGFDNKSSGYEQYSHALSTLIEYKQVHEDSNYNLDKELVEKIEILTKEIDINFIRTQINTTKEQYFKYSNSSFNLFLKSRYSARNFYGKININNIIEAIEIAKNSPSACNRQPSRVHIIESLELKTKILKLQGGNRGFGHLADKVLVVTAELAGYRDVSERNGVFIDGGLFSMNLLNALHYKKILACPLNWYNSNTNDIKLREVLKLPQSQTVIMLIACGDAPDKFKLAYSKKNNIQSVYTIS